MKFISKMWRQQKHFDQKRGHENKLLEPWVYLHSSLKRILLCFFQVEKILDVILSSPGTRIGQASECFVYWKDDRRNDTWGLNFTSPIDAKQFRECCDFSKSSARYLYKNGLRLGSKSSPASPTKQEPQCTCLVSDKQQTKLRSMQNRGKSIDLTIFCQIS